MYSLYLQFLDGLSLRNTSKALVFFKDQKRRYVSVWNRIQRFGSYHIYKRVSAFIIDKTVIQIGNQHFCQLWFCIEPIYNSVLGIHISRKKEICLLLKNLFHLQLKTYSLYRRWGNFVYFTSMQILTSKTLFAFGFAEKPCRESNTVFQR